MKKYFIKRNVFVGVIIVAFIFFGFTASSSSLAADNIVGDQSFLDRQSVSINLGNIAKTGRIKSPKILNNTEISIGSSSYVVIDRKTLSPLAGANTDFRLPVGSLAKLMTAVVALEEGNLGDIVTIRSNYDNIPEYQMGIYAGEEMSLENLLYGVLISSSNDAAQAIAEYFGQEDPGLFIKKMNAKAKELGMKNTSFVNAIGLDGDFQYSTVQDLAYLANYAAGKSFISDTVKLKEKRVKSHDGLVTHYLANTNQLLLDSELGVMGMKTGYTPKAGGCLITLAEKNGNEIITVVLGSDNRFGDTKKLIQWTWDNIRWQ